MNTHADHVASRMRQHEEQLAREAAALQKRWNYRLYRGRVWFDREIRLAHRRFRQSVPAFIRQGSILNLLTAPIIYTVLVPLLVLDMWLTLFQWICFPIYGVAIVPRRSYFVLDRHKLAYLNAIEKVHCSFCSYANGLFAYAREIAARTEQYWCPIKHAQPVVTPHSRYQAFVDYGDPEGYRRVLPELRRSLHAERRSVSADTSEREHTSRRRPHCATGA
jgi:hypothetical protein